VDVSSVAHAFALIACAATEFKHMSGFQNLNDGGIKLTSYTLNDLIYMRKKD
jgi:hypothetical protein